MAPVRRRKRICCNCRSCWPEGSAAAAYWDNGVNWALDWALARVLLKMPRTAESQADFNGALIMAEAGYNPIQMAQLFEKLEAQQGQARSAQFLSDHPNPGN